VIYLLDTNAFSDLVREHPQIDARLASVQRSDPVVICSIVRGEVLYGIEQMAQGRRRRELESKSGKLFGSIPCEPVPVGAGDHYARVKLEQRRKGLTLDENDLWIVATAMALGAVLVSRDTDFRYVAGLLVEDWTA
jgi:predicted nucleic acid-binding protein